MSNAEQHDFERFMREREAAAQAYVSGDAAPLGRLVAQESPATFFSPQGTYRESADAVWETYAHDAGSFVPGSESHFEILHMAASEGLGYWVGFQRAMARMQGQAEPIPFNLRITEIFRRDAGEWKMIHRHADVLRAEGEQKPS